MKREWKHVIDFFTCANLFKMSTDTEKEVILDMHKMYFGSSLLNIREKHVSWDEQTISEHDKERGTRRIINEPKTPYNRLGIPESNYE